MINERELRIGNYVLNTNGDTEEIIRAWQIDEGEEYFGIPLTEEWLLKFGGEIKPYSIGVTLDRFRFIWKEAYGYWYVVASDPGGAYMTKIEFVHELQNFYRFTNGEELTIKD